MVASRHSEAGCDRHLVCLHSPDDVMVGTLQGYKACLISPRPEAHLQKRAKEKKEKKGSGGTGGEAASTTQSIS